MTSFTSWLAQARRPFRANAAPPSSVQSAWVAPQPDYHEVRHEAAMRVVARSMNERLHGISNPAMCEYEYDEHKW